MSFILPKLRFDIKVLLVAEWEVFLRQTLMLTFDVNINVQGDKIEILGSNRYGGTASIRS